LKKYGNSKWKRNLKYLSRILLKASTSLFMQCCAMCKIEFHDEEFRKMKRSNVIELLKFSIEEVWKMIF